MQLPWGQHTACNHAWGGIYTPPWHTLSSYWQRVGEIAQERDEQKRPLASSRYWNQRSHFVGLLGELVFAIETRQAVDVALRREGDGGTRYVQPTRALDRDGVSQAPTSSSIDRLGIWIAILALSSRVS